MAGSMVLLGLGRAAPLPRRGQRSMAPPAAAARRAAAAAAVAVAARPRAPPAAVVPLLRRVAAARGQSVRGARRLLAKGLVHVDGLRCSDQAALVAASSRVLIFSRDQETGGLMELEAPPTEDFYLKIFKPRGVICSHRKEKLSPRPIVAELYPEGAAGAVHPVGRLDRSSEGLLLLSSDGTFSRFATMPEVHVEKEYLAVTNCARDGRPPSSEVLERLRTGVELHDGQARAVAAEVVEFDGTLARLRLVVTEGRFHIVRRMLKAVGYGCWQLLRTRVGSIQGAALRPSKLSEVASEHFQPKPPVVEPAKLGDPDALRPGEYAELRPEEVAEFYRGGLAWMEEHHPV